MARIPFQKPKHIEWEINSDRYARLVAEPFEKGYALTVGNSLRRTLLSIIPGAAVSWVRIAGVSDAESKIPGVREETSDAASHRARCLGQQPGVHCAAQTSPTVRCVFTPSGKRRGARTRDAAPSLMWPHLGNERGHRPAIRAAA